MYDYDSAKVFWKQLGEDTVLMNVETGEYFSLDEVGAFIWSAWVERRNLDDVYSRLADEYDVDSETARSDVGEFFTTLEQEGLVFKA